MLYVQGNLRAEENALRQIARKKINFALQSIEEKTARLVDSLLKKLTPQIESAFTIESLLESIRTHPQMQIETATIEHYSKDFPELQERVTEQQNRINSQARATLAQALAPFQTSRRFRFTKGFRLH